MLGTVWKACRKTVLGDTKSAKEAALEKEFALADKDGDTASSYYVSKAPTEEAMMQLFALLR